MNAPPGAEALYRDLPSTLEVLLHQIDLLNERVLLARVTASELVRASFLDQRVLAQGTPRAWLSWSQLAQGMHGVAPRTAPHYLFHIGHCGSTLLSRLYGELGALPLREPLPLRSLAELHADLELPHSRWDRNTFDERSALVLALDARGNGARCVKATSYCNDLAPCALAAHPGARATVCYVQPAPYIAGLLAGPASRLDMLSMAPLRMRRLEARVGGGAGRLAEMSPGVIAAMSWITETAALAALLDTTPPKRLRSVDFDAFLADVPDVLALLARHALGDLAPALVERAATSATLGQYSKAPEHAYDRALRRRVLADADLQYGTEIRAGMNWCNWAAGRFPAAARALELFASTPARTQ